MKKIHILLLLVMMLWGFNLSALKVLVVEIDPFVLTAFRIFIAGITVLLISKGMGIFRFPTRKEWSFIIYIGFFNVVLHHMFLALGLYSTSGVNAGLILGSGPLLTMMLSILILKDVVTRLRVCGFFLGFAGILLTTLAGSDGLSTLSIGDGMVFISIFAQAFSFILISKLNPTFDPRLLTGYMLVFGSVVLFVFSLFMNRPLVELEMLFSWKFGSVFLFSAVLCTAFGHMTYNYAIKQVGPVESTIFINLNTFFALVGAAIFLGEPIIKHQLIGLVLILAGVFIGSGSIEYIRNKRKIIRE
ncbi:MAG TPA: DMT family transporter [Bacillota bacterium]|nr:DMT family transporter [Bacillota bacterium]